MNNAMKRESCLLLTGRGFRHDWRESLPELLNEAAQALLAAVPG